VVDADLQLSHPLRRLLAVIPLTVVAPGGLPGEDEIWNRSGQKGRALQVLRIMWANAHEGIVCFQTKRLAAVTGLGRGHLYALLKKLEAAREIEKISRPVPRPTGASPWDSRRFYVYRLTPSRALAPKAPKGSRLREPRAQAVLFRTPIHTTIAVPRALHELVARFQDVMKNVEPRLRGRRERRPNLGSAAGWLLCEGFRFASRNRVHGLGREPAAAPEDLVQLGIHVDRKTWRAVRRAAVMGDTNVGIVVPRLIELGAQVCQMEPPTVASALDAEPEKHMRHERPLPLSAQALA